MMQERLDSTAWSFHVTGWEGIVSAAGTDGMHLHGKLSNALNLK